MSNSNTPLSHHHFSNFEEAYQEIKNRIAGNNELEALAEELAETTLGRFLIINRGANAYWTDVVVNMPNISDLSQHSPFEQMLLLNMPIFKATQERFIYFKQACQKLMKEDMNILSAPSGLLPEFMPLDYAQINSLNIDAIDIDPHNFELLKPRLQNTPLENHVAFKQQDIFNLSKTNQYDLVVSNGLNIYIPEKEKVRELYTIFYNSLKKGGTLITSSMTPPPPIGEEWDISKINLDNLNMQKSIFVDILNITWSCYMSAKDFSSLLSDVGFKDIQIEWDSQKMFPTFIAQK